MSQVRTGPRRVLLIDVETSPNVAFVWGRYEQDVVGDFISERQIISFAWKWLDEKTTHVLALPSFKGYKRNPDNNRALVLELHKLISEADIVVGHNVDAFDDKMSNCEFIIHGLTPPPPHKTIDTLKVARSRFRFNSNKLGDLAKRLNIGEKVQTGGFQLWLGCLHGNLKSWAKMKEYNKNDVILLEKIYLKMRPWINNHPNMNAADGHVGCPACRGTHIIRKGWNINKFGKTARFQCQDCGKSCSGQFVRRELTFR